MNDYFNDYATFGGAKGLPSPADTPYETPSFLRSKRSSRATTNSTREPSPSPPPLPPDISDFGDKSRDGKFGAMDLRRFTPTLHASLVSEILSLRRELDSKNSLVENLETGLSAARRESEALAQQLSSSAKEVRFAKRQVQQMEKGTYDVVEELVGERDVARATAEELKSKLEAANKASRRQDDDALVTQRIWDEEKQAWDSERRQLERRVHVTESRLRAVVDELAAHEDPDAAVADARNGVGSGNANHPAADDDTSKDSGLVIDSEMASMAPASANAPSANHRRSLSSISANHRHSTLAPDLGATSANSLADELGMAEEEDDTDGLDQAEDEFAYPEPTEHLRQSIRSRQNSVVEDDTKAKRVLGLIDESVVDHVPVAPATTTKDIPNPLSIDTDTTAVKSRLQKPLYVDSGCQPSPPDSPIHSSTVQDAVAVDRDLSAEHSRGTLAATGDHTVRTAIFKSASPISPPDTPVIGQEIWTEGPSKVLPHQYSTAATQTDEGLSKERPVTPDTSNSQRHSLSPPSFVPFIAVHPPKSRPSTPRAYVLPPRTRNASTQASLMISLSSSDACTQTEEIRIDPRSVRLPPYQSSSDQLPSLSTRESIISRRTSGVHLSELCVKPPPSLSAFGVSPVQSPSLDSPTLPRDDSQSNLRTMPLRAIPLPRPVLSPVLRPGKSSAEGPLNRSAQYGVSQSPYSVSRGLLGIDVDKDSDPSDNDGPAPGEEYSLKSSKGSLPGIGQPYGRIGPIDPPKAVPEDKEISPERRPETAASNWAAPAPSVASSRISASQRPRDKHSITSIQQRTSRTRSPSFASAISSIYSASTRSAVPPPFPIPARSSSRVTPYAYSDASQSPTTLGLKSRDHHRASERQNHLRKTRSAAVIRQSQRKASPVKPRRRRRSPTLTPVQSMALESPAGTQFPLMLPGTLPDANDSLQFDGVNPSFDLEGSSVRPNDGTRRGNQDPNLVDAIAATMVGEWMWKYIRKRKSFGVGEDLSLAGGNGSVNAAAHGSRHRRWVWLSPYERCIMWDNRQPTSGNALLGKKGRKLAIHSVLDVADETPLPRSAELATAHNRSILVLTPERALKFTAISYERHMLWMTALAFLAESGGIPAQTAPLMPTQPSPRLSPTLALDGQQPRRQRSPSFGRSQLRDSIRLTKSKRPSLPKQSDARPDIDIPEDDDDDAAAFPTIPRLYNDTQKHHRKRSNTAPRLPTPLQGLRSLSSSAAQPSTSSIAGTTAVLHPYPGPPSNGSATFRPRLHSLASSRAGTAAGGTSSSSYSYSRHDSLATCGAAADRLYSSHLRRPLPGHHFFEAVGTVRMEAFVDPNVRDGVLYVPGPPLPGSIPGRHRGNSAFSSVSTAAGGDERRRGGYGFGDFAADPFGGF